MAERPPPQPAMQTRFRIDFLADYSEAAILQGLSRIASLAGAATVTKAQIDSLGRVSYATVVKRFGSLRRALQLAGPRPQRSMKATDSELLDLVVDLWEQVLGKEGRTPQRKDLRTYNFDVSGDTIVRRFGTWKKALKTAYESVSHESAETNQLAPAARSAGRTRQSLSIRKRISVMKRDGFSCARCGASGQGTKLEVHHILPFAHGGTDSLDNLQTLCFPCNRGQRNDPL
jgi:hypothetical protein